MKQAHVDHTLINSCMTISGGVEADGPNTLLEAELSTGIVTFITPSMSVSIVHDLEHVIPTDVFLTICSNFAPQFQPDVCQFCWADCRHNIEACVSTDGVCPKANDNATSSQRVSLPSRVLILFLTFALTTGLVAFIANFLYGKKQDFAIVRGDDGEQQPDPNNTTGGNFLPESEMSNIGIS
jgi:hypothetical protein